MSVATWNYLTSGSLTTPDGYMGGRVWDLVIPPLITEGTRAFSPTLGDEQEYSLSDHIDQVLEIIIRESLDEIILVGHSYGGMVITGVAARIPHQVLHLVYLDAAIPDPGQSLYDVITSSGQSISSIPGLRPFIPYVQKITYDSGAISSLPKTYLLCTKSFFLSVTRLMQHKALSSGQSWTFYEVPTSHVPMATNPDLVSNLLLSLIPRF